MIEGYTRMAAGAYCEVHIADKALKEYRKAPPKDRARVESIIGELAANGPDDLVDTQLKFEGRFPIGGKRGTKLAVWVVKSYQLRVYGGYWNKHPLVFLCPEVAIKKTNKADQELLRRVAKKVGEHHDDQ